MADNNNDSPTLNLKKRLDRIVKKMEAVRKPTKPKEDQIKKAS